VRNWPVNWWMFAVPVAVVLVVASIIGGWI
jgi:hypothetical protein